jgi:serine/threonine protein kinase
MRVVHRDLKCENLLLDADMNIKIIGENSFYFDTLSTAFLSLFLFLQVCAHHLYLYLYLYLYLHFHLYMYLSIHGPISVHVSVTVSLSVLVAVPLASAILLSHSARVLWPTDRSAQTLASATASRRGSS